MLFATKSVVVVIALSNDFAFSVSIEDDAFPNVSVFKSLYFELRFQYMYSNISHEILSCAIVKENKLESAWIVSCREVFYSVKSGLSFLSCSFLKAGLYCNPHKVLEISDEILKVFKI